MQIDNIPLEVLQAVDQLIKESKGLAIRIKNDDVLLHLIPRDKKYKFNFIINKFMIRDGKTIYSVQYNPESESNILVYKSDFYIVGVTDSLNRWLTILSKYPNFKHLEEYETDFDELYEKLDSSIDFEIIGDDLESTKYDFETEMKISGLLDYTIQVAETYADESNEEQIENLKEEVTTLQKLLPKLTKKEVVKRFKKVLTHCYSISTKLVKEIFVKVSAELVIKVIKGEILLP